MIVENCTGKSEIEELDLLDAKCEGAHKYWLLNSGLRETVCDIQKDTYLNSTASYRAYETKQALPFYPASATAMASVPPQPSAGLRSTSSVWIPAYLLTAPIRSPIDPQTWTIRNWCIIFSTLHVDPKSALPPVFPGNNLIIYPVI